MRDESDRFGEVLVLDLLEIDSQVFSHVLLSFFLVDDGKHHWFNLCLQLGVGKR